MADRKNTSRILGWLRRSNKSGKSPDDSAIEKDAPRQESQEDSASKPNISSDIRSNKIALRQNQSQDPQIDTREDSDVGIGEPGGINPQGSARPDNPNQRAAEAMASHSGDYNPNPVPGSKPAAEDKSSVKNADSSAKQSPQASPQESANKKPEQGMIGRARGAAGNLVASIRNRGSKGKEGAGAAGDEEQDGRSGEKSGTEKAAEGATKAKDAVDWAQKGARALAGDVSAIAQLAVKGIKNLWQDPKKRWVVIVGAGIMVVGTIIALVIPFALLSGLNGSPNPITGHDQPKLVNPIADKDVIKQTLANAGDPTTAADLIDSDADKMKINAIALRDTYSSKADDASRAIVNKIDLFTSSVDTLKANKTPANAKTFLDRLTDLDNSIEDTFPTFHPNETTAYPTKAPVPTTNLTFNNNLHGGSKLRPEHVDNDGVYTAYDQGVCDAVDLSASVTDAVYPIFGGIVDNVSSDGADGKKVVIRNGDYRMLYAHLINVNLEVGGEVTVSTPLGNPKMNHVQIEAIYQSQCLTTTYGDLIDYNKKTPKHDAIGGYLWDRIVEKFHISM